MTNKKDYWGDGMKTTFIQETNYPNQARTVVTVETDAICIDELTEEFRRFLLAAGFQPNGVADLLGEEK